MPRLQAQNELIILKSPIANPIRDHRHKAHEFNFSLIKLKAARQSRRATGRLPRLHGKVFKAAFFDIFVKPAPAFGFQSLRPKGHGSLRMHLLCLALHAKRPPRRLQTGLAR